MSLKKRFKKGLREFGTALTGGGGLAALAMSKKDKKKKMLEGIRKATGQSATQAAKIKQRVDIAAKRKAAIGGGKKAVAAIKTSGMMMKKEKKPLK